MRATTDLRLAGGHQHGNHRHHALSVPGSTDALRDQRALSSSPPSIAELGRPIRARSLARFLTVKANLMGCTIKTESDEVRTAFTLADLAFPVYSKPHSLYT